MTPLVRTTRGNVELREACTPLVRTTRGNVELRRNV